MGCRLRPWKWMPLLGTPSFSRAALMLRRRCCISAIAASTSAGAAFDCAVIFKDCGETAKSVDCVFTNVLPVAVMSAVSDAGTATGAGAGAAGGDARAPAEYAMTRMNATRVAITARRASTSGPPSTWRRGYGSGAGRAPVLRCASATSGVMSLVVVDGKRRALDDAEHPAPCRL